MGELVSILIPAYNAERWINETIKSALGQTWPNCEIIVVDDGSTDNTYDIARGYQSKSVKVIRQENMGASVARNTAISLAQGDYIQWLDADDLIAADKISLQLEEGNNVKNSLILLSSSFGTFFYRQEKAKFIPTALWKDLLPVEWLLTRFADRVWMNPAVWLVSRRLTEQVGSWDERLTLNDDGEYFARVVAACEAVKFIPEAKSYYRQANAKSLSKTQTHKASESLFLSLKLSYGYLLALEESERTRAAVLGHLQNCLILFYPEEHEILAKADEFASDLRGNLSKPELKSKYFVVRKIFGWNTAKRLAITLPKLKKRVFGNYDRLMFFFEE